MHKRTLKERFFYKIVYVGEVKKDGQTFKKYKKVARFPKIKFKTMLTYLAIFIAAIMVVFLFNVATSGLKPKGPQLDRRPTYHF